MLAAPILNPIVLATTWVAYGAAGKALEMTAARAALGLLVAISAGALIGRHGESLMRSGRRTDGGHDHDHKSGSAGAFVEHLASDFLFMGRFLVLGAAVAALLQTAVPQDWLSSVADLQAAGRAGADGHGHRAVAVLGGGRFRGGLVHRLPPRLAARLPRTRPSRRRQARRPLRRHLPAALHGPAAGDRGPDRARRERSLFDALF